MRHAVVPGRAFSARTQPGPPEIVPVREGVVPAVVVASPDGEGLAVPTPAVADGDGLPLVQAPSARAPAPARTVRRDGPWGPCGPLVSPMTREPRRTV
ncbi:hypothetical protein GCM10009858_34820 [Terrabacter carboxydivorans]|uniref:Uncharacterized protein n=1 Tax=Terrabacter carboxydivorans TaxID=619730 RepID=A0ABN3M0M1_9MICO